MKKVPMYYNCEAQYNAEYTYYIHIKNEKKHVFKESKNVITVLEL